MFRDWSLVENKHIIEACKLYDSGDVRPKIGAKNTHLFYKGNKYPAKFIRGIAYELATGVKLNPSVDFSGGKEALNFFIKLGFTIIYAGKTINGQTTGDQSNKTSKIELNSKSLNHPGTSKNQKIFLKNKLEHIYGRVKMESKFDWLVVPDITQNSDALSNIYLKLSQYRGYNNFHTPGKQLRCDFYIPSKNLIIEYDERQHFSQQRAIALSLYPKNTSFSFDLKNWRNQSKKIKAKDSDKNVPYRDEQRAFYDSVRDILSKRHGVNLIRIQHGVFDWSKVTKKMILDIFNIAGNEELDDVFWKAYEIDLQEAKLAYLRWALTYATEPKRRYRHKFLWDEQKEYCLVNSRYGRSFSMSPYGVGVQGVPKQKFKYIPPDLHRLKLRLKKNTGKIRQSIRRFLEAGEIDKARAAILNWYWLKIGPHELLFDGAGNSERMEPEDCEDLDGIRNRIINVLRYGEELEDSYVMALNQKMPNNQRDFLSSRMTWNKYAICAFDCGPIFFSKKHFVHYEQVKQRMQKIDWPRRGTARELLEPLYEINIDYQKSPIRHKSEPDEGYSLSSIRKRGAKIHRIIENAINHINSLRENNILSMRKI